MGRVPADLVAGTGRRWLLGAAVKQAGCYRGLTLPDLGHRCKPKLALRPYELYHIYHFVIDQLVCAMGKEQFWSRQTGFLAIRKACARL